MFEVRRLRLLRELADRGTIAATAQACSLTPSAVSQQLGLLEREARTPLLLREGRRVVLTEAARILVGHTERVLAELEQARAELAALRGTVRGTVRLAAFPTAAHSLVPAALAECRQQHPDLRVLLEDRETAEAVPALKAQQTDVAVVYEYPLLPRVHDPGVELVPLLSEPLLLALPPGHAPSDAAIPLEQLRDEHWVAPPGDTALRAMLQRACAQAGFEPRLDYASDDYTVIVAMVEAGLGMALIPQLAVEPRTADVELRPMADPDLTRTVSLAIRAGSSHDPLVAALRAALQRAARARFAELAAPPRRPRPPGRSA